MSAIAITGGSIWTEGMERAKPASVIVEDNRITRVALGDTSGLELPAERIDASGQTLIPGMVEGHCHPSFVGISTNSELGRIPPEEHTLRTAANVRLLLDHGFTSIFEAASAKPMIGVAIRNAIEAGLIAGPRMRAASPEVTATSGLGDERRRHIYEESFGLVADGVPEFRRVARECIRDGVDNMKINISGDQFVAHAQAEITTLMEDELDAFVSVAHSYGKMVAAHARSSLSVKLAVRNKVDCIYHCDFADEEALDQLESVKDSTFVGPAFGLVHNCTKEGDLYGLPRDVVESMDLPRKFDACCATYQELRKRGARVVVGGDYGFSITPMGQNARDLQHFVTYFGFTPIEALCSATTIGAQLMGTADEVGRIREGFLADLLLVRGDPTEDVSLLQGRDNLSMIMKDGVLWKDPRQTARRGDAGLIQTVD